MPRKTHASKSSSGSSSGREAGTSRVATRAATGRAATGRAATGRVATGRAATGRVATQAATGRAATQAATGRAATGRVATQAATGRVATGRVATQAARSQSPSTPRSPSTRAAFAAAVAAKDTNRFHNLTTDLQIAIMKMARKKDKVKLSKYDIYKKIFRNPQLFIDWLDELKRDGVDNKKRVRNPLHEGGLIYTDKAKGLYPILYNLCFQVLQGNYVYDGVPRPVKIFYKKPQLKFYNKPPDSPPDKDSPPLL